MDSSLPKTQCIIYYKVIWQISKFSDQSPSARGILSLHVQETPPMNTYQPAFLARILKESLVSSINTLIVVYQFSSVTQSCLTLCNPMDCSTPGFPVHHQLP